MKFVNEINSNSQKSEVKGCGKHFKTKLGTWLNCGDKWGNLCDDCKKKVDAKEINSNSQKGVQDE